MILYEFLLLLFALLFDLVTTILDFFHEVVVGANTVAQVHEEAIGGQFEAASLLLDPSHCDGSGLIEPTELMLAGLDSIGLLDALLVAFLKNTLQSLDFLHEAIRSNDVLEILQQASLILVLGLGSHE